MFRQLTQQGRRFMNALTVGTQAGLSAYRYGGLLVNGSGAETAYTVRAERYAIYDRWYRNAVFDVLDAYAIRLKEERRLYRHIRSIYNPVHRLVDIETCKVYGGQIDWTGGLRVGAIPVIGADKTLTAAIVQVFKWSNFGMMKDPYVRSGAKKGDRFLKVIDDANPDDPTLGRVRLEVLDPYKVRAVDFDAVGHIKFIAIQYYDADAEGKAVVYREEIDQSEFRFWLDRNTAAFDNGVKRDPDQRYPNPYGFVPVKHAPHVKEDDSFWGATSFGDSLGKILELNDQVSQAHDAVRKALEPIYVAKGGQGLPEQDAARRERDRVIVLNVPRDGDVTTITPTVDMPGVLGNIDRLISEIENDNPQLTLQHIRDKGGAPSGVAIENSYSDASGLLIAIQGNCDEGLIGAVKMAISVGAFRGYAAFRSYDPIKSYERGDLDFYIKPRDVFEDRVSQKDRIQLLNDSADKITFPVVARTLEYSDDDIALMEADRAQREADAMRGLSDSVFGPLQQGAPNQAALTVDNLGTQDN